MLKKILLALFLVLLIVGVVGGIKVTQIQALIKSGENKPEEVSSVSSFEVKNYPWQSTLTSVGSLEAAKGLLVTADLSGRVTKIHFNAGTQVMAGDLLLEQDISTETAQLRSAKSAVTLAENNFSRIQELYEQKVVSKSEFDNAESNYLSAVAQVENIQSAIDKKKYSCALLGSLGDPSC